MADKNVFFEYLKALYDKSEMEYDQTKFNPYLMLMWISHDKNNFTTVERINKFLYVINPKYIWQYLRYKLPYNSNKFLKWAKKDQLDLNEELINQLCAEHGISKQEAKQYVMS